MTFDAESFPFTFLEAFGNKETTIKRLLAFGMARARSEIIQAILPKRSQS